ncbi:MAG: hypothetical protein ACR2IJ_11775 [Fluviibacter sp.]
MSVYSVSNKYLDTYDPFWVCRLLSLKVGTATILLFLINGFILKPQSPMLYIMITLIGTLASEVMPAPTRVKKILIFIGIDFLLASSMLVFQMFSYFRWALFAVLIVFTYLSLRFMVANPKAAVIPTLMIMFGVVSSSGGATDFTAVANSYLYYFVFGLAGIVTILFFPDFTPNIAKSAFIRILESDVANVGNAKYKNSNPAVLTALSVMHGRLPLLPECYRIFYEAIIQFQNDFMRASNLNAKAQMLGQCVLSELIVAVQNDVPYFLDGTNAQRLKVVNDRAYSMFANLVAGYNQCKV